jgi:hypothetical protein
LESRSAPSNPDCRVGLIEIGAHARAVGVRIYPTSGAPTHIATSAREPVENRVQHALLLFDLIDETHDNELIGDQRGGGSRVGDADDGRRGHQHDDRGESDNEYAKQRRHYFRRLPYRREAGLKTGSPPRVAAPHSISD